MDGWMDGWKKARHTVKFLVQVSCTRFLTVCHRHYTGVGNYGRVSTEKGEGEGEGEAEYSSSQTASPLRELTCHMGSHCVTCHPAKVTLPPLPQPVKAGTQFSDPGGMQG